MNILTPISVQISSFSGQVSNGTKDSANPSLELSFPVESGNQHTPPTGNDKVPVASAPAVATDNTATSVFIPTVRPESESHKGFGSQIVQITSYAKVIEILCITSGVAGSIIPTPSHAFMRNNIDSYIQFQ